MGYCNKLINILRLDKKVLNQLLDHIIVDQFVPSLYMMWLAEIALIILVDGWKKQKAMLMIKLH